MRGVRLCLLTLAFSLLWYQPAYGERMYGEQLYEESASADSMSMGGVSVSGMSGDGAAGLADGFTLDDFDSDGLQAFLDSLSGLPGGTLSFREIMEQIAAGDLAGVLREGLCAVGTALFSEIKNNLGLLSQIVLLSLIGAVFSNFSGAFGAGHVSETGFYVVYLLIMTLLAASFYASVAVAEKATGELAEFMKAMLPAYFLAVSMSGGALTSAGVCGFTLAAIGFAEQLLTGLFVPFMRVYMMLVLAGNLYKEDMISHLTELLRQGILWGVRALFGVVVGFHLVQGMILPQADALKNASAMRLLEMVPGVGAGAETVSQIVMGSGVLIKNTAGAAAVAVLALLAAVPMAKLAVLMALYSMAAAAMQPVCDKRLVACMSGAAAGNGMLLRLTGYSFALFAATLAVLCVSTNAAWYAG